MKNCALYRSSLIELARGGKADRDVQAHVRDCAECGHFLEQQESLSAAFRVVGAREEPALMDPVLMTEFASFHRPKKWIVPALAALAASAALVFFLPHKTTHEPAAVAQASVAIDPPPVTRTVAVKRRKRQRIKRPIVEAQNAFIAIPYTMPLTPYERTSVLRMEMPASALIAAGYPLSSDYASSRALADVVVSADGLARAVRLISISAN